MGRSPRRAGGARAEAAPRPCTARRREAPSSTRRRGSAVRGAHEATGRRCVRHGHGTRSGAVAAGGSRGSGGCLRLLLQPAPGPAARCGSCCCRPRRRGPPVCGGWPLLLARSGRHGGPGGSGQLRALPAGPGVTRGAGQPQEAGMAGMAGSCWWCGAEGHTYTPVSDLHARSGGHTQDLAGVGLHRHGACLHLPPPLPALFAPPPQPHIRRLAHTTHRALARSLCAHARLCMHSPWHDCLLLTCASGRAAPAVVGRARWLVFVCGSGLPSPQAVAGRPEIWIRNRRARWRDWSSSKLRVGPIAVIRRPPTTPCALAVPPPSAGH